MSQRIIIPVPDHNVNCSQGYIVRYKPSASIDWITLPGLQQVVAEVITPSPLVIEYRLIIEQASDSTQYDIEGIRQCCDGTLSSPTLTTFTTGS